jgi:superoxide reductase
MKIHFPNEEAKKKHTPVIEAPSKVKKGEAFEVKVIVGKEVPHPQTSDHYIKWISLWADEIELARVDLDANLALPTVTFVVKLEKTAKLSALSYCNLHGMWHSEEIEVVVEE